MIFNEYTNDKKFGEILKGTEYHISDPDFEDKLMQRIELLRINHKQENKTIKISWLFFLVSLVLFPMAYLRFNKALISLIPTRLIKNTQEIIEFIFPVGIILFSVIMLIMLDYLLKISFKKYPS